MDKKITVITGGTVFTEFIDADALASSEIICADSGYNTAAKLQVKPSLLVGDLDSIDRSSVSQNDFDSVEKLIVPSIKDDTDTQLAVDTAISHGATEICIIGGLSGRADHTLSSVFLLENIAGKNIRVTFTDGKNKISVLSASGSLKKAFVYPKAKYLSLISLSDICRNVSVSGVFYPLSQVTLERKYSYAVSNEITSDCAEISLSHGTLLIIESND